MYLKMRWMAVLAVLFVASCTDGSFNLEPSESSTESVSSAAVDRYSAKPVQPIGFGSTVLEKKPSGGDSGGGGKGGGKGGGGDTPPPPPPPPEGQIFLEDFESGSKGSYAAGSVAFLSGSWLLDDALVGTLSGDVKNGTQSVRMRNTGILAMEFNSTVGIGEVTIQHASYTGDGASNWVLEVSVDNGASWQAVGNEVASTSSVLSTASFTVNQGGDARIRIRKTSGGTNRINIDDISVTEYIEVVAPNFLEDFEAGSKGSYATGSVSFATGAWTLSDALIGTLSSDVKNGTQSVRIRNSGYVNMDFDATSGIGTATVHHAIFSSDGSSSWQMEYSNNAGATWNAVGPVFSTVSGTLEIANVTVNQSGNVRLRISKVSGGGNRINIDDISFTNFSGGTPSVSEDEPNDNPLNATNLVSGGSHTGTLSAATDVDYFSFTALSGQSISSSLSVPSSVNLDLYIVDDLGGIIGFSENASGDENIIVLAPNDGVYYVVVQSNDGSYDANAVYTVTLTVTGTTGGGGGGGDDPNPYNSVHLTFGNPSDAIEDVNLFTNYLLNKDQYVVSYNRNRATANWVSWHLDSSWRGSAPRQDDFRADNTLPAGWYQVTGTSYSLSGFNRGHITPSADRTASVEDNSATFLMTNMIPQSPDNNQGPWAQQENYLRSLADAGNELYIIAGAYGQGGDGSNGFAMTINNGNIVVPARVWKVAIVLPSGDNDVARVTTSTRVIAVDMPNTQGIRSVPWTTYRTSVDAIEAATGLDLFEKIEDSIEDILEAQVDSQAI